MGGLRDYEILFAEPQASQSFSIILKILSLWEVAAAQLSYQSNNLTIYVISNAHKCTGNTLTTYPCIQSVLLSSF